MGRAVAAILPERQLIRATKGRKKNHSAYSFRTLAPFLPFVPDTINGFLSFSTGEGHPLLREITPVTGRTDGRNILCVSSPSLPLSSFSGNNRYTTCHKLYSGPLLLLPSFLFASLGRPAGWPRPGVPFIRPEDIIQNKRASYQLKRNLCRCVCACACERRVLPRPSTSLCKELRNCIVNKASSLRMSRRTDWTGPTDRPACLRNSSERARLSN